MKGIILLSLLCRFADTEINGDLKLLLVQTVWRHGDRSPMKTCQTDPIQERNWTFGGGGYGQLSPIGMKQHLKFGKLLRKKYVEEMGFLSKRYSSKEIYIRSTDRNRTIISAISNLLGMYGQNDGTNVVGMDYPDDADWPAGFVPVAIHTSDHSRDHVANPDSACNRQAVLWAMAKSSRELQAFQERPDVAVLLLNLTRNCGETVNIDNLPDLHDALYVEQIHANDTLRATNTWFSDEMYNMMTAVARQVRLYKNGIFNEALIMNNLDVGLEIQKIRGGSILNEISTRMSAKMECLNKNTPGCKWISGLKYYAYSAHDSTIFAIFCVMGIQDTVVEDAGYPQYTAAIFFELWLNITDNRPYFKVTYRQNPISEELRPITKMVDGCTEDLCSLEILKKLAKRSKPDLPMEQWCELNPQSSSSTGSLLYLAVVSVMSLIYNDG